jgi:cation:H+ antiporter
VEVALQVVMLVGGLTLALLASDRAVGYTRALAARLGAPPFVVGVALVAVGTDLPEIANSIVSHLEGAGDVNVGDSVGSTLTQYTLILGLFPLVIAVIAIDRREIGLVTVLTIVGLVMTSAFVADGWLARWEGVALISAWALFTLIVVRVIPALIVAESVPAVRFQRAPAQAVVVLVALAFVGLGATVAVRALVRLAELAGIPEFLIAFFGLSLGTSAPELVVDITALLRGAPAIAIGDAVGSSLVDATLSIGAGPVVAPAPVTPRLALVGISYTVAAVAVVGALLVARRRHDRASSVALFAIYAVSYAVVLGSR